MSPVAITGRGVVTPLGAAPGVWQRVAAGDKAAGPVAAIALDALPEPVKARAVRAERVTQLVLAAAAGALAEAGLCRRGDQPGAPEPRRGVVLGTAFGCFLTNAEFEARFAEGGPPAASPRLFAATVSNAAAGELGIAYRLGGPAITLTAGGAAGLVALGHATDLLREGRADVLVAGGVDALGDALVRWLDDGALAVGRPASEAAALVVLEGEAAARARGADVLGTIAGHATAFEPEPRAAGAGDGLAAAVEDALADAGVVPRGVDAVVSAAPLGLAALEARALARALGQARPRSLAPKDVFGETFGAAGPLGLLAALAGAARGSVVLVLDVCASGHVAALVARRA
jgi:3-oxoacyl-[acyl-carrier-protein] synthase II